MMNLFLIGNFEKIMIVTIAGWMIFLLVPPLILGVASRFIFKAEHRTIIRASISYILFCLVLAFLSRFTCLEQRGSWWNVVCGVYTIFWEIQDPPEFDALIAAGIATELYFLPVGFCWFWGFLARSPKLKIFALLVLCLYNAFWGLLCIGPFP